MHVFITGGGGFLGQRLVRTIADAGRIPGPDGNEVTVSGITCFDQAHPHGADSRARYVAGDVGDPAAIAGALPRDTGAVFHLAAVVSGGAEADFDLGMRVNMDGTRALLEACRALGTRPRVVFTSSVAAFGGVLPDVIDDRTIANPQSSYGAEKVIGEYLVAEYGRRGFVDGRTVRLPTIVVRPGKPNAAASSFASGIIREPLAGTDAICPVGAETGLWILSPARAIASLVHAHALPSSAWGMARVLNLPGITVTVGEMVDTLGRLAGRATAERVKFVPDERIGAIVRTWPARFATDRANALGFRGDADFESIVRQHAADTGVRL